MVWILSSSALKLDSTSIYFNLVFKAACLTAESEFYFKYLISLSYALKHYVMNDRAIEKLVRIFNFLEHECAMKPFALDLDVAIRVLQILPLQ